MNNETYPALAECARRRIDDEWRVTAAEEVLLRLVCELSFDLGQSWACVPCLADFADVLGIHKSTVSRALRSARKKGYVQVLMRAEETLYGLCLQTREATPAAEHVDREEARRKLVELNKNRLQGTADADGQQRLPGILPSEETEAPALAFEAILEQPQTATQSPPRVTEPVPRGTQENPASRAQADDESHDAFQARLEGMVRAAERRRQEEAQAESVRPNTESPPPRTAAPTTDEQRRLDAMMHKICAGLKGEPLHAMQRLREEFASAGKLQEAAFFNWGMKWRQRCKEAPLLVLECAGAHKDMRLNGKPAKEPGAWIWSQMRVSAGG